MKKIAVYAGTFDPITLGHVDIIERASALFDEVIVAVAESERKKPFFALDKRITMVESALEFVKNSTVKSLTELTVDFAEAHGAHYLVRGLRSVMDYAYEADIAEMNRQMSRDVLDTIFLSTSAAHTFVSSSIVRELILLKAYKELERFLPEGVLKFIEAHR